MNAATLQLERIEIRRDTALVRREVRAVVPEGQVVWLRVADEQDRISVVPLRVRRVVDGVDEVRCAGRIIGYVQRVAPLFVALVGSRLDRAEECSQAYLWDKAAARLLVEDAGQNQVAASSSLISRRPLAAG